MVENAQEQHGLLIRYRLYSSWRLHARVSGLLYLLMVENAEEQHGLLIRYRLYSSRRLHSSRHSYSLIWVYSILVNIGLKKPQRVHRP
jgi:hypothetical protein